MLTARGDVNGILYGRYIYVMGGTNHNVCEALSNVEAFDIISNKWYKLKNMTIGRSDMAVIKYHSMFYVFGGETKLNCMGRNKIHPINTIEIYDPLKGASSDWKLLKKIKIPKDDQYEAFFFRFVVASWVDSYSIFFFGGVYNNNQCNTTTPSSTNQATCLNLIASDNLFIFSTSTGADRINVYNDLSSAEFEMDVNSIILLVSTIFMLLGVVTLFFKRNTSVQLPQGVKIQDMFWTYDINENDCSQEPPATVDNIFGNKSSRKGKEPQKDDDSLFSCVYIEHDHQVEDASQSTCTEKNPETQEQKETLSTSTFTIDPPVHYDHHQCIELRSLENDAISNRFHNLRHDVFGSEERQNQLRDQLTITGRFRNIRSRMFGDEQRQEVLQNYVQATQLHNVNNTNNTL